MNNKIPDPPDADNLRQLAANLRQAQAESLKLVHELQVHQIELELQNEELRRARDEIEAGLERYADLYEFAPLGYLALDRQGTILQANLAAASLLGIERSRLTGRRLDTLVTSDSRPIFHAWLKKLFGNQARETCEVSFPGGEARLLVVRLEATLAGKEQACWVALLDVTETLRAQEAQHKSEKRFGDISDHMQEWIWEVDPEGKYTYSSQVVENILGYQPEEILQKHFYDLFHPDDRESLKTAALAAFATQQPFREFINRNVHKNGQTVWISTSGIPLLDDMGNLLGYRGVDTDITERRQVEEALRKSEKQYRDIYENAIEGIFQSTPDGRFLSVNPAMAHIYGYTSPDEMRAAVDSQIDNRIHMDAESRTRFTRLIEEEGFVKDFEAPNRRKDGSIIWTRTNARTIRDAGGAPLYYEGFLEDITERKWYELGLQKSEEKFKLLTEKSFVGIYIIQDAKMAYVNPSFAHIFGYEPEEINGILTPKDLIHPDDIQAVMNRLQQRLEGKTEKDIIGYKAIRKDGSMIYIDVYGVLVEYQGKPAVMGTLLDVTERKQAEEALRENEQRMSSIYDTVGDIIFYLEVETGGQYRFISVNPSFYRVTGLSQEQIIGKRVTEVIPEPSLSMVLGKYHQVIETKSVVRWEEISNYPSGRLDGEVSVAPVFDDKDRCTYLVGSVHDITKRKRAEEALRQTEKQYRDIFENAIEGIFQSTPDGRFLSVNPAMAKLYGYTSPDEMIAAAGSRLEDMVHVDPQDGVRFRYLMEKDGYINDFEALDRRKDGSHIWIRSNAHSVFDIDGASHYYEGFLEDITERKQAEEALKKSEKALVEAQQIARIGSWEYDIPAGKTTWSRQMFDIFGRDPSLGELSWQDHQQSIHPDDWETLVASEKAAMTSGIPYNIEFRLLTQAKEVRWGWTIGKPVLDSAGKIVGLRGTTQDITERKRSEEALRESEERFRTLFEQAAVSVALLETKTGRFRQVNQKYCDYLGYTMEEMLNKSFQDVTHPEDIQANIDNNALLLDGRLREFSLEKRYLRKDGSIVWGNMTVSPLWRVGEEPPTYLHIAVVVDITERKRAEEEIKKKVVELERFNNLMVGRELKMIELKKEINRLLTRLGEKEKYKIHAS